MESPPASNTAAEPGAGISIHQQSQAEGSHQIHLTVTGISQPNYAPSDLWSRGLRNRSYHLLNDFPFQATSFAHGLPIHPQPALQNLGHCNIKCYRSACNFWAPISFGYTFTRSSCSPVPFWRKFKHTTGTPRRITFNLSTWNRKLGEISALPGIRELSIEKKHSHCKPHGITPAATQPPQAVTLSCNQIFVETSL